MCDTILQKFAFPSEKPTSGRMSLMRCFREGNLAGSGKKLLTDIKCSILSGTGYLTISNSKKSIDSLRTQKEDR